MIHIPSPSLRANENCTPFSSFQCQKMGKGRLFYDVVVLKGTFDLARGKLEASADQAEVVLADEYHDAADVSLSSLARPGDLVVGKPFTDVVVTGTAHAPGGKPLPRWSTMVRVRRGATPLIEATFVATGPRSFAHGALRGWRLSDPEPTCEVPIRYELAYGGAYPNPKPTDDMPYLVDRANPSGRGFFDLDRLDPTMAYPGPQWETVSSAPERINASTPLAGFGPVARMWSARTLFGGTYDVAWEKRFHDDIAAGLAPDYPGDFDMRFFQCAHPSLVAPTQLRSGDAVDILGLAETAELSFELPQRAPKAEVLKDGQWTEEPVTLDLVHVDLDTKKVFLSWRVSLAAPRRIAALVTSIAED